MLLDIETQKVKKMYHLVGKPLNVPCLGPGRRSQNCPGVLEMMMWSVLGLGV